MARQSDVNQRVSQPTRMYVVPPPLDRRHSPLPLLHNPLSTPESADAVAATASPIDLLLTGSIPPG